MAQRELLAAAFERSPTPMTIAEVGEVDSPVIYANPAFLALTGYGLTEVVGRDCRFLQGSETSRETVAEISAAIEAGQEITATLLNYRKEGGAFWNKLHLSPFSDGAGKVTHFLGSQVDVTETLRIAALEASERRLLKEVDHRAKNLMAVVTSIVRLSKTDDADRYAASVRERVQTLADVHSLLAENGWQSISLEVLLRQEFGLNGVTRVHSEGPLVKISATDAQPVALIIHELAANAMIHGALSVAAGTVDVQWRDDGAQGIAVSWTEHGRNVGTKQGKAGFGTKMVDALAEKQLKGTIHRDWREGGLVVTIHLPHGRVAA